MKKVTYKTSNLYSLKKYKDSNLNCRSYEYLTPYQIKCAILGSVIKIDGVKKAEELFHKIKNAIIYVQYPKKFKTNGIKLKRYSNAYYSIKDEEKMDREKLIGNNFKTTMGFREYVYIPELSFYIDNSIPNLELYLKNIDWLGTAESLVYLDSIEDTKQLKNVLLKWNKQDDVELFEVHDFDMKTEFENVYMYSDKYKHLHKTYICYIGNLKL